MKTLDCIAIHHGTDKSSQHHNYCSTYENYFLPLRDKPINLLEIGVQFGLSLKTWLDYFTHPDSRIYGIDCVPDFKSDHPRLRLFQGDQRNKSFILSVVNNLLFNIIIDDGCHQADAQAISFNVLWPYVRPGGYYIIEDCFTWSDPHFQVPSTDGYEWLGFLIGDLFQNGKQYHGKPNPIPNVQLTYLETSLEYIHLHRGLVIIKKKP